MPRKVPRELRLRNLHRLAGGWNDDLAASLESLASLCTEDEACAATRVRHCLAMAIHRFLDDEGFYWVHTPIVTAQPFGVSARSAPRFFAHPSS